MLNIIGFVVVIGLMLMFVIGFYVDVKTAEDQEKQKSKKDAEELLARVRRLYAPYIRND